MQIDAVVGVEARVDDGGDGRRKPILDRKIKKRKMPVKNNRQERKSGSFNPALHLLYIQIGI